ncbi:MAG: hypothetical protein ACKOA4_06645, partial [Haliscomenobacter sp.]
DRSLIYLPCMSMNVVYRSIAVELEFHYTTNKRKASMRWAKGTSWSKSYMGQHGGAQPERTVYLRTLANLTSPSEVRSVLQIGSGQYNRLVARGQRGGKKESFSFHAKAFYGSIA